MKKLVFLIFLIPSLVLGLAPHPIYFSGTGEPAEEHVEIAGVRYVVRWDGASLSLTHGKPADYRAMDHGILPPNDEPPNWGNYWFEDDDEEEKEDETPLSDLMGDDLTQSPEAFAEGIAEELRQLREAGYRYGDPVPDIGRAESMSVGGLMAVVISSVIFILLLILFLMMFY